MSDEITYPAGELSAAQQDAARFGRELFARVASTTGADDNVAYSAYGLGADAVVIGQNVRGGGRIYVAADHTVLFAGSAIREQDAVDAFEGGRRTPIEKFGPAVRS